MIKYTKSASKVKIFHFSNKTRFGHRPDLNLHASAHHNHYTDEQITLSNYNKDQASLNSNHMSELD